MKEIKDLQDLNLSEPKPWGGKKEDRKFSLVGEWDSKNLSLTVNENTVGEKLTFIIYDQKNSPIEEKELEVKDKQVKISISELVDRVPNYVEIVSKEGEKERIKINTVSLLLPQSDQEKGLRKNIRRLVRRINSTKSSLPISTDQRLPNGKIDPEEWYRPESGSGGSSPLRPANLDYFKESQKKFEEWIDEELESAKENEVLDNWVKEFLNRLEIFW